MPDDNRTLVPVWTLATGSTNVPAIIGDEPMTPERLAELRNVLAAMADSPIATLEVHPIPEKLDRSRGIALDAASPLAKHLSDLITQTAKSPSAPAAATAGGEALYRMVVPAKVAAQFGSGVVKPMASKGAASGIYSALTNASGIVAQASFVPVGEAAAAGAAGGAAATAGVAVGGSAAITVAAPLVLLAVAVGVSAYADYRRQQAIQHITELLEELHEQKLEDERSELDGCRDAIDKATAILLDQGKLGPSLGLDSATFAIGTALAAAERRLTRWEQALAKLPQGKPVEVEALAKTFRGIDEPGGEFRTHLELATLAVALKRRVVVLQAVEHAQSDEKNPFENFVRILKSDEQRLDKLETGIASVLVRLSALELGRPRRTRDVIFMPREVDHLLSAAHRIHQLGDGVELDHRPADVAIEIARNNDGSVVVFPAIPA